MTSKALETLRRALNVARGVWLLEPEPEALRNLDAADDWLDAFEEHAPAITMCLAIYDGQALGRDKIRAALDWLESTTKDEGE